MVSFIEKIGEKTIISAIKGYDYITFIFKGIFALFNFGVYTLSIREKIIEKTYRKTISILPLFLLLGFILGSIIIVIAVLFAINYNLQEQVGKIIVSFVANEFAPLFTTFYIFFHYGYSLFEKENNKQFIEDYLPKAISSIIAVSSMSLLLATIMLIGGYAVSSFLLKIDLSTYQSLIITGVELKNIILLLIKGMFFGFVSVIISSYYLESLDEQSKISTQKIVNIFALMLINIFIIEILFLFIAYY